MAGAVPAGDAAWDAGPRLAELEGFLVEVPGAVLVIGMAGDRMDLLDKIVEPEIRAQLGGDRKSSMRFPIIPTGADNR